MPTYNLYYSGLVKSSTIDIPTNVSCNFYQITVKSLILNNFDTKPRVHFRLNSFIQEIGYLSQNNNELINKFINQSHMVYQHPLTLVFDRPLLENTTMSFHIELKPRSNLYFYPVINKQVEIEFFIKIIMNFVFTYINQKIINNRIQLPFTIHINGSYNSAIAFKIRDFQMKPGVSLPDNIKINNNTLYFNTNYISSVILNQRSIIINISKILEYINDVAQQDISLIHEIKYVLNIKRVS